jgi:hypothetical protein
MEKELYSSTFFTAIVQRGFLVIALSSIISSIVGVQHSNGELLMRIIGVAACLLMSMTISRVTLEGSTLICQSDISRRAVLLNEIREITDIPLILISPIAIVRYESSGKIKMIWFIARYSQSFRNHTQLDRLRRLAGLL